MTFMNNIENITQLLQLSGSQYRLFDVGRKIDKISKEQFEKIELNQIPYPTPSQGHAFIAVAFWQKQSTADNTIQPYLWLLKLPLDERGLLNQGARNHFVAIIVEALGSDLTKNPNEQQEELLKNNPYIFTPAQYKLAALNSKIKVELKQEPSKFLSSFITYIKDKNALYDWRSIGVQGITDFAARINKDENSQLLIKALPQLPSEVLLPLCSALENESLPITLIESLLSAFNKALHNNLLNEQTTKIEVPQHLLRSLASNCQHPQVNKLITELLQQPTIATELLLTLSGRCWPLLEKEQQLMSFLEHLINGQDSALFNAIFKDLVAIPTVRPIVFQCMRSPERSQALAQAIGQLFQQKTE